MPHIIIEYSENLEQDLDINLLMKTSHEAAFSSGLFGEADIKVRVYRCDNSLVAGQTASTISILVRLLAGRDAAAKKALTQVIHDAVKSMGMDVNSLSVEAVDMERESYSKSVE